MQYLEHDQFTAFLERFSRFGDGKVRKFSLTWEAQTSYAEICLEAMDGEMNWQWVDVHLTVQGLCQAYWATDWRGSIECAELVLRRFDDQVVVAVGGADDAAFDTLRGINDQSTAMLLVGNALLYKVVASSGRDQAIE